MKPIRFLLPFLLLLPAALPANLRAPWHIQPFSTFSLLPGGKVQGLTVLGETLEFACDSLFQGDPDAAKLGASACRVKAVYRINSTGTAQAGLEFIGPSAESMTVQVNGRQAATAVTKIQMGENAAARYGMIAVCRHCGSDDMPLYSAKFQAGFQSGANEIVIAYTQPLASREASYGYFQTSTWAQSFDYELWPLKEWNLAPGFTIAVRISSPKPGLFSRLFKEGPQWKCGGIQLTKRPPLPVPGSGPGIAQDDLTVSPIPLTFSSGEWIWSATLDRAFPDRLSCSME